MDLYNDIVLSPPVEGVEWVHSSLEVGKSVLCHCNMGVSRSPSIAMVAMACLGELSQDIFEARAEFYARYDRFLPGQGMTLFVKKIGSD